MKENLNKITDIYGKKPVKANPTGLRNIDQVYSDSIDERVQLPELNKLSLGTPSQEYSGLGTRSNSTVH